MAKRGESTATKRNPLRKLKREQQALVLRLQTAYAVAATSVAALEGQNADRDIEIAQALTRCVLDPIVDAIEYLESNKSNNKLSPSSVSSSSAY